MPAEEFLRAAGYSLLLAGFLFLIRWWAETRGKDRGARDRRIAIVLVAASLLCALVAIMLTPGDS
jgi:hypothetical protein